MLVHLLVEIKTISVGRCAAQMYVFSILGLTECCLLAAMAYDRFVAICHPLHYSLLMDPRVFEIGCSILDHWGCGGISPDHVDLHSALLWNRKDPALFLWHHACSETSLCRYLPQWDCIVCYLRPLYHDPLSPHSVLLCAHSGDHPENPFSHWQKQSFLHLLFSYPGCFSLLWHCLVHLPPTEGCTRSRNRHGNRTHVHSGHTCSESSYLHLEEQGREGSLSKNNTKEHSQTNDLNLFITKLFRNPCISQKYFLDIFLLQFSWIPE